jgi:HAE1 family hydrophobic/amphiphilic exporter-1
LIQIFESLSSVSITLTSNADVNISMNDAQRKINAIINDLPDDAGAFTEQVFVERFTNYDHWCQRKMDEVAFDLVDKKLAPVLSRVQG